MTKPVVSLDVEEHGGWLAVVIEHPTGVIYENQIGGMTNYQGRVEGFLVPVFNDEALAELQSVFEDELRGGGTRLMVWDPALWARLRAAVDSVTYWPCDAGQPVNLAIDEERAGEVNEAWIPVLTPDGRGVLVWNNSD